MVIKFVDVVSGDKDNFREHCGNVLGKKREKFYFLQTLWPLILWGYVKLFTDHFDFVGKYRYRCMLYGHIVIARLL